MLLAAPAHRQRRYLPHLVEGLPDGPEADRAGRGLDGDRDLAYLFPGAVAAIPGRDAPRGVLARHGAEDDRRAAEATGPGGREIGPPAMLEGFTQAWSPHHATAVTRAQLLGHGLRRREAA